MSNPRFSITYTRRNQTIKIYALADIHYGSTATDHNALSRTIAAIQHDPNARWIGLGDYLDCNVKRASSAPSFTFVNMTLLAAELKPIASQCIGLIKGNVERELDHLMMYEQLVDAISEAGNIPAEKLHLGREAFVQLSISRVNAGHSANHWRYVIYAAHDLNHHATTLESPYELVRTVGNIDADLIIEGHTHVAYKIAYPMRRISSKGQVVEKMRYGVLCPPLTRFSASVSDRNRNDQFHPEHSSLIEQRGTLITLHPADKRRVTVGFIT